MKETGIERQRMKKGTQTFCRLATVIRRLRTYPDDRDDIEEEEHEQHDVADVDQ
jgi:hypothetical protein